ncbi:MAG: hypothetical protein IIA61_00390 [Candidatus Marinimicrobia bacterium]|nr:hypothetical protein [Candidatus Neomarinimicrobiota bacterium]
MAGFNDNLQPYGSFCPILQLYHYHSYSCFILLHPKLAISSGNPLSKHPQKGKVFQEQVRTNRNRENADLVVSFDALLTLYKYFKRPLDLFVVVLHSDSRGTPPFICTRDANCTADHFLYYRIPYEQWYNHCITFERSFLIDSN